MTEVSAPMPGPHYNALICDIGYPHLFDQHRLLPGFIEMLDVICYSAKSHFVPVDETQDSMVQLVIHQGMYRPRANARRFRYLCPRLFFAADNVLPDWRFDDWGISFAPLSANNFHYPAYTHYIEALKCSKPVAQPEQILKEKTKFCAFVYNNKKSYARQAFFHALSQYMRVDGLGNLARNTPNPYKHHNRRWFKELYMLQQKYKFAICFENLQAPDYFSEKIFATFIANAVPIYLGAPNITDYINPDAFIHARDFDTPEALAKYVLRVHKDKARYLQYLGAIRLQPAYQAQLVRRKDDGEAFIHHIVHTLIRARFLPKIQRQIMARELLSRLSEARIAHLITDFHNDYRPNNRNKKALQQEWWQTEVAHA